MNSVRNRCHLGIVPGGDNKDHGVDLPRSARCQHVQVLLRHVRADLSMGLGLGEASFLPSATCPELALQYILSSWIYVLNEQSTYA